MSSAAEALTVDLRVVLLHRRRADQQVGLREAQHRRAVEAAAAALALRNDLADDRALDGAEVVQLKIADLALVERGIRVGGFEAVRPQGTSRSRRRVEQRNLVGHLRAGR